MTHLYNLESYSELCTYTNLYEKEIESSLSEYKNFLDTYQNQGYFINYLHPKKLSIKDELISIQYPGIELSQENNNLYIIPDRINSLNLSNILKPGEDYIYKSVYHYWNYYNQIADNLDFTKPTVIVDLNSLSNESYCCLEFKQDEKTFYHIPIIDNRTEADSNFKISLDFKGIHDNIYHDLAQYIISSNFPQLAQDEDTIKHLKSYLQKIQIFKIAQCQTDSDTFLSIVEISYQEKIYYKSVNLEISLLEDIVINKIDIKQIATFTNQHPDYSFILISDYNFLPKFREALNNNKIFLPDNRLAEFPKIWLEKQHQNFPLFGQYLDKIKFKIKQDGQEKWIEVLSELEQEHIYYENESDNKEFIARIQETGQEYFQLSYPYNILPIKINEQDYCINNKIQEYKIIHPCSEAKAESEKLIVRIEFIVKLGSVPQLRVIDAENKYKIEAKLCDRKEIIQLLGYIPLNNILENRQQQSDSKNNIDPKIYQEVINNLSVIKKIDNLDELILIKDKIKSANEIMKQYKNKKRVDLFLYVNPYNESFKQFKDSLNNLYNSGAIDQIKDYFDNPKQIRGSRKGDVNTVIINIFSFIGKTYRLSELLISQSFFSRDNIKKATNAIGVQYYSFLSKVAFNKEFQLDYFNLFEEVVSRGNQPSYKINEYLWGYSRILLWYSEFYNHYQKNEFFYLNHFRLIAEYLCSDSIIAGNNQSKEYQKNAFLSLIYLLTFREIDSQFCTPKSEEYKLAEQVVNKYKKSPVNLNIIPDKPLNEYFEELLKSKSSQKAIRDLVEVANKS